MSQSSAATSCHSAIARRAATRSSLSVQSAEIHRRSLTALACDLETSHSSSQRRLRSDEVDIVAVSRQSLLGAALRSKSSLYIDFLWQFGGLSKYDDLVPCDFHVPVADGHDELFAASVYPQYARLEPSDERYMAWQYPQVAFDSRRNHHIDFVTEPILSGVTMSSLNVLSVIISLLRERARCRRLLSYNQTSGT